MLIGIMLAPLAAVPTQAGVIVVAGPCSAADAITAANTDAPAGGCPAGSGADILHLAEDVPPAHTGGVFLSAVTSEVVLKGHGRSMRRGIVVEDTGVLTLQTVNLGVGVRNASGGDVRLIGCTVQDSIFPISNSGTMMIIDSLVTGNHPGSEGSGAINAQRGHLFIENTRVTSNRTQISGFGGGGIFIGPTAEALITNSVISDNQALGAAPRGGGIYNQGNLTLFGSTLAGNRVEGTGSAHGGAIANQGTLIVDNSTFSGNEATAPTSARGGAVSNEAIVFPVFFDNSTFLGNQVTGGGTLGAGGIHNVNTGTVSLKNTIVTASTGDSCQGTLTDNGGNFGCLGGSEVTRIDPVLRNNGGPTSTHALLAGSNAIDAGGTSCLAVDQRIAKRAGDCDSGAFEWSGCLDDLFELGSPFGDNTCPGAMLRYSGSPQAHRFCDQDWVFFRARASSEYLVETSHLTGGADTRITALLGCSTVLGSDDNGGAGLASRLSLAPGDGMVGIGIDDPTGTYGPGRTYDVTVTCTSNCPCPASDGMNLDLSAHIVSGAEVHEVCDTLTAGPSYTVDPGGILILGAGKKVVLENGFSARTGGTLQIETDPSLWPLD
jgi:hypothetical protein